MNTCKWCNETFNLDDKPKRWMINHTKWCLKNPKREEYLLQLKLTRLQLNEKKKTGDIASSNQFIKAKNNGLKLEHSLKGKRHPSPFKRHTEESKSLLRDKALKSTHRRLRKKMIEYKGIMLDSSWEYELAKRLDELKISWARPNPLKWVDTNGLEHHYFPDFYLPAYDLYLDPKNPIAFKVQENKITILKNTYSNILFLTTLDECINFNI